MASMVDWARVLLGYLEWQALESTAALFYSRLGYRGEPCPQPDHPTFEIDFGTRTAWAER